MLPPGTVLRGVDRRDALLDFGDAVNDLGGRYHSGEDVGTSAEDMWVARERTPWVHCLPVHHGGSGEPSELTAVGTFAAIEATWRHIAGTSSLAGQRISIVGLGQVGGRLAGLLAEAGAELTVADIDPGREELARTLGARWVDPGTALTAEADILVPAALGGMLTDIYREATAAGVVPYEAAIRLAHQRIADAAALREAAVLTYRSNRLSTALPSVTMTS